MGLLGLSNSADEETALVFDIDSASVGGAVVRLSKKEKPVTMFSTREDFAFQNQLDFDRFLREMLTVMQRVAERVQRSGLPHLSFTKRGNKKIDRVICIFSSPWYVSQTKILRMERKKPVIVSPEIERELMEQTTEGDVRMHQDRPSLYSSEGMTTIEQRVVQVKLNGYETTRPYGKSARIVEAALFLGMVAEDILKAIDEILTSVFHTVPISFHSFPLASFSVLRDLFPADENFMFLDIGGEVTDVSLVQNGILLETASFPFGIHALTRDAARALRTTPEEADSQLRIEARKEGTAELTEKLDAALSTSQKDWVSSFQNTLVHFSENGHLPLAVFIATDSELGEWFVRFIQTEQFIQPGLVKKPFRLTLLSQSLVKEHCVFNQNARQDLFLMLETIFLNKLFQLEHVS